MTRTYIAGPMTGLPELNFPAFHRGAAVLRGLGWDVVNPAEINVDPEMGWSECMRADIAQLVTCQRIALLPGWQHSRGAKLEHHIAMSLGMETVTLTHDGTLADPWGLTPRQSDVMRALAACAGCAKKASDELRISAKTVDSFMQQVRERMGARTRTEAILMYDRWARGVVA